MMMQISTAGLILLLTALGFGNAEPAEAQSRTFTDAECQGLRERLAAHASLSPGVRQALAARPAPAPAAAATAPAPPPATGRAEEIKNRLDAIAKERQTLEDQRLAAMVTFELSRAGQIQGQIQTLDAEKSRLEAEMQQLPATVATTSSQPATTTPAAASDVDRVACRDLPAMLERTVAIRQRELGAREGQVGAVPLTALAGTGRAEIARELDAQLGPWPAAAGRVGLLDQDGDGRIEGFVDAPAPGIFRLYRERSGGALSVEVFAPSGSTEGAYADAVRRLDEETARRTQRTLADLLAVRAAGPVRVIGLTATYPKADEAFRAASFADAAAVQGGAARSVEFPNYRGETVRAIETIAPGPDGAVIVREVVVTPAADGRERWQETTTQIRKQSYWQTDVQVVVARETHEASTGSLVGARSVSEPIRFTLDR